MFGFELIELFASQAVKVPAWLSVLVLLGTSFFLN